MRKSLLYKLIIVNAIILGFVFIFLALTLSVWFKGSFFDKKRVQLQNTSQYISKAFILNKYKNNLSREELQSEINIASISVDSQIAIINSDNEVLYLSSNIIGKDLKKLFSNISNESMNILENGECIEYINDSYTHIDAIMDGEDFLGYIVMISPLSIINGQLHKIYMIIWISSICTIIFSIFVIALFTKTMLINPLEDINSAAKKIANGEVDKRVSIKSKDEIGQLASSFNSMAESLEKVEKNRRDFISNVSHELRSPITSIKGFIAAIIDGVIPKEQEGYYLKRVYSEIQRLTRLINDLLDLSAIESGKLKFNIEKIDINELIRICIINNEGKIKKKGIILNVNLMNDKCYVNTDRDKTMQVITNLLDNAIKYCKNNGNIKIDTYSRGHKILVEIFNDGPQLTDEELIHIWDRFYKSDKARTNKVSTGLGLPIVRMILMQQGEEIYAKNDDVKGVSFIFTLTKYSLHNKLVMLSNRK